MTGEVKPCTRVSRDDRGSAARRSSPVAACLAAWLAAAPALAAPPLTTEDGASADRGELGIELWLEGVTGLGDRFGLAMAELALAPIEWLELAVGGGVGLEGGPNVTAPNPYGQIRLVVLDGADEFHPSLGLVGLVAPALGRGIAYADETAAAGLAAVTYSFFDERWLTHFNVGITGAPGGESDARALWGAALELDIPPSPVTYLGEVFAGDPLDPGGPRFGAQLGVVWEVGDVAIDVAVAAMEDPDDGGEYEWIGRLGVSHSVDLFSRSASATTTHTPEE